MGACTSSYLKLYIITIRLSCPIIVRCESDTFCSKVIKVNDRSTHGCLINCFEEMEVFFEVPKENYTIIVSNHFKLCIYRNFFKGRL